MNLSEPGSAAHPRRRVGWQNRWSSETGAGVGPGPQHKEEIIPIPIHHVVKNNYVLNKELFGLLIDAGVEARVVNWGGEDVNCAINTAPVFSMPGMGDLYSL